MEGGSYTSEAQSQTRMQMSSSVMLDQDFMFLMD